MEFFNDAVPGNLDSTSLVALDNGLLNLDSCENSLEYLYLVLNEKSIPLGDKKKLAFKVLTNHIDLKSHNGRLKFVLCMVSIFLVLYSTKVGSFYLLMEKLLEAVRKGKISKAMARVIIRRLRRKGIPVDPELIE